MVPSASPGATLRTLDAPTRALVRLAARIAGGSEDAMRTAFAETIAARVSAEWTEEVILQSCLFAGFPRSLNAAREWRRVSGVPAPTAPATTGAGSTPPVSPSGAAASTGAGPTDSYADVFDWRISGEATCRTVYGRFYEKLRENIRALHPALDDWMIVDGYGKVLSRPGLDLARRELCIVAACVATAQDRQLHSHLHGARHAGADDAVVREALRALEGVVAEPDLQRAALLWEKVARLEPRGAPGR